MLKDLKSQTCESLGPRVTWKETQNNLLPIRFKLSSIHVFSPKEIPYRERIKTNNYKLTDNVSLANFAR